MFKEVKVENLTDTQLLVDNIEDLQRYFKIRSNYVANVMSGLFEKLDKNKNESIPSQLRKIVENISETDTKIYLLVLSELNKGTYEDFYILDAVHTKYMNGVIEYGNVFKKGLVLYIDEIGNINNGLPFYDVVNDNEIEILKKFRK